MSDTPTETEVIASHDVAELPPLEPPYVPNPFFEEQSQLLVAYQHATPDGAYSTAGYATFLTQMVALAATTPREG